MSRSARIVAIAIAGTAAGIAAAIFTSGSTVADLAVLTAACVIGELVELRPAGRAPLPLSFAIVIVLVRAATPVQFVIVVVARAGSSRSSLRTEPRAHRRATRSSRPSGSPRPSPRARRTES